MNTRLLSLLALAFLVAVLPRAARAAGSIRITTTPAVLLADGVSTTTVTAEVRNTSGRPARDGTEVRFYTTAGNITPVAFTSAGVARATLTASAVPQAANVSVSVGIDQAVTTVPMVSKLVEAAVGGRVMRVTGKYVAFSEDQRFIQADQQVRVKFRGIELQANSVQVDLNQNTVKALGKVQVSSDGKLLVGERLWLDLKSFEGYMMAVGARRWFSGYGLTDLPEKPKNANPDFELVDLSNSKLLWVGKTANYVYNERVQVQGARAYVAGIKSLRMPFHQSNLSYGFNEQNQYVGIGSEGITLDLPLYVRMTPGSSTAFRMGYGSQSGGIGYFTRNRGLSVDLVHKYGFSGASEGEAQFTNLTSFNQWGFFWNHTQQFSQKTRLVSSIQFPSHRDIYGQFNLTTGLPVGTLQASIAGAKPYQGDLANTLSLAFESKPKPLAKGRVAVSVDSGFFRRDAQTVQTTRAFNSLGTNNGRRRIPLPETHYGFVGLRLRPKSIDVGKGFTFDSSATLRAGMGNVTSGFGPGFEGQLRRQLPRNGYLSLGVNYNPLTTFGDLVPQGRMNGTFNLSYPITTRLRVAALGSLSLDSPNRHSILQMSYAFAPKWRLELLHTMYQFGNLSDFDYQFGVARSLGSRDLAVYWSRREHKFLFQFGAASF